MPNEIKTKSSKAPNQYLLMVIIFWLGVLTGAMGFLMSRADLAADTRASILTSPLSNFQFYIPTPPGGISAIGSGTVSIPTPPGGIPANYLKTTSTVSK